LSEARIVRIPLPVDLIRQMDALILGGRGGFENRAEFITDAIRERILEFEFEPAEAPSTSSARVDAISLPATAMGLHVPASVEPRWATTEIAALGPDVATIKFNVAEVPDTPLFGLHNRDYPSLWAAYQLAEIGISPLDAALGELTRRAWVMGDVLREQGERTGRKTASLFPTNREKKQAGERRFVSFAVGSVSEKGDKVNAAGPLFQWGLAGVERRDDGLHLGLSAAGAKLLGLLGGLDAREPHSETHARQFLEHIKEHAEADWSVLLEVIVLVASNDTRRAALIAQLRERFPDWSENEGSTNCAGYIARGREWGLLSPKQDRGLYLITDLGRSMISESGVKQR
jgi:hypothetical protein